MSTRTLLDPCSHPPGVWPLLAAVLFDCALGEVPSALHPVVWMGRSAAWLSARVPRNPVRVALMGGGFIALGIPAMSCALAFAQCASARARLADHCRVNPNRIVLGNGASELLWTLTSVLGGRRRNGGRSVLVSSPAFGEVSAAANASGLPVVEVPASPTQGFTPRLDALASAVHEHAPAFVYLCNPGTPTGAGLDPSHLAWFTTAIAPCPLLLDESFLALSDHHAALATELPTHVIRVRSLTKDFAIPGVRTGYAIAPEEVAAAVTTGRPPWTVGAAAQAVAEVAPSQVDFPERSRAEIATIRAQLAEDLARLDHPPYSSVAPYLAFDAGMAAEHVASRLLDEWLICVRDCASFGLPKVIRVGLPDRGSLARLTRALRAVFGRC